MNVNDGLRYVDGKPRFDLLPPASLFALADHFRKGCDKYAERNWERGMDWSKCFGSLMRHAWKWAWGEDVDSETGTHHMIAVAWNAMALYEYHIRKIGRDDRVKQVYGEREAGDTTEAESVGEVFEIPEISPTNYPRQAQIIEAGTRYV